MRAELFFNPLLLIQRIAIEIKNKKRLNKLRGTVARNLSLVHITSLEFLEIANKNLSGGVNVIFDIGANEGKWTLLAKAINTKATIHAFEPTPQYQMEYSQNIGNLEGVYLHKVGAGSENKTAKFNFAKHSSSFLEITDTLTTMYPSQAKSAELEVEMVRIDDYVLANNIPYPDIMKLDVEGFELEVLKGGLECLRNCKYIILEVGFIERHLNQPLFHEIINFMAEQNFHIYSFPESMHLAQKIYLVDILFENYKYASSNIPRLE